MKDTLRPGYKQTEVGVIPEDWSLAAVSDVGVVGRGRVISHKEIAKALSPVYPVYSSQTSDDGVMGYLDSFEFEGEYITWTTDGANAGTVFHRNGRFNCTNVCGTIKVQGHDARFISRVLARAAPRHVSRHLGNPKLMNDVMKRVAIPIAPFPEQRAIADALSDVDALWAKLDQLIAKKRDLKQAAMQQLLTGQNRLPGFSGAWEVKPVFSFSDFVTKGATPTTYGFKWVDDGVLFLRSECVAADGLDLTQSMFITEEAHAALRRGEVRAGDILMTITGNVGRVVRLSSEFEVGNINQHIARIRVKDPNVFSDFVFHWLSQDDVRKNYALITTGQAYPQISLKQVRETLVPIPIFEEQTAIATVLSDMDADIAALEARRDKTRAIKQGMMQALLTGRIRLV